MLRTVRIRVSRRRVAAAPRSTRRSLAIIAALLGALALHRTVAAAPCASGTYPTCGGDCPAQQVCMADLATSACVCRQVPIRPEDCPSSVPGCPCGTNGDDTACWQWAIDQARPACPAYPYFGKVIATPGKGYIIKNTLKVHKVFGGEIDGQGAFLDWRGPYDPSETCGSICQAQPYTPACNACAPPMFRIEDARQLTIRNLSVTVVDPTRHLNTAFEFTNSPDADGTCAIVTPTHNSIEDVTIDGIAQGRLDYGIRATVRYNLDAGNDNLMVTSSSISNPMVAAIYIDGFNAHNNRLYMVDGYGVPNDTNPAVHVSQRFVWLKHGGFDSIGGFHAAFAEEYYIENVGVPPVTIIDSTSERCGRMLATPPDTTCTQLPVHIVGGHFELHGLNLDGGVIDFHRQGPLTIHGLHIDGVSPGTPPAGAQPPVIRFDPSINCAEPNEAKLDVTGSLFSWTNANGYDIVTFPNPSVGRVTFATGNSCGASASTYAVLPCFGRLGGTAAFGYRAGKKGLLNLPNLGSLSGRNVANSDDVSLVRLNASDQVELADGTHVSVVSSDGSSGGLKVGSAGAVLKQVNAGQATSVSTSIGGTSHGSVSTNATGFGASTSWACSCSLGALDAGSKLVYEHCYVNASGTLTLRLYNAGNGNATSTAGPVDYVCAKK